MIPQLVLEPMIVQKLTPAEFDFFYRGGEPTATGDFKVGASLLSSLGFFARISLLAKIASTNSSQDKKTRPGYRLY